MPNTRKATSGRWEDRGGEGEGGKGVNQEARDTKDARKSEDWKSSFTVSLEILSVSSVSCISF